MQTVINEFKQMSKSNTPSGALGRIKIIEDNITISEDTDIQNISIEDNCYVNDKFIGTTVAKKITVNLFNEDNIYDLENKEIETKLGFDLTDGEELVSYGNFIIEKPNTEEVQAKTNFTGYDYMIKFDVPFVDNNTYPIRLGTYFSNLCTQVGLVAGNTDFINSDYMVLGNPFTNGETCRVVLSAIAQIAGGIAKIGRDNKPYIINLSKDTEVDEIDGNNYDTFTPNKVFGPINKIIIKMNSGVDGEESVRSDETSIAQYGECAITISDNPILNSAEQRELVIDNIFNALKGITYLPYKMTYYGYPQVDSTDKVKISNVNDTQYSSYIFNHTINYDGTFSGNIETSALTKTQSMYKNTANLNSRFRKTELAVDKINGEITQTIKEVNNITNTQGEAEGKNIHIEDSAEEPFVDVSLHGESTQEGTPTPDSPSEIENIEGRNKFSGFVKGIAINSTDGHQLADETRASSDYIAVDFNQNPNYYLSGLANTLQTFVAAYNSNKEFLGRTGAMLVSYFSLNSSSFTGGTAQGTGDIAYLRVTTYENTAGGTTGAIDDVDNLETQLEEGTVATPYVPYNSLEFKVEGKNKLKGLSTPLTDSDYWYSVNSNYFETLEDGWGKFSYDNTSGKSTVFINVQVKLNAINLKPNTQYTIITEFRNSTVSENAGAFFTVTSGNATDVWQATKTVGYSFINQGKIVKLTATTKEDFTGITTGLATYLRLGAGTSGTVEARISVIEGDYDTTDFDYEPYKSQVVTFPLGEEKLMEGSYLADDGIHHTRKQVVLDGSEGWKDSYYDTYGFFYIALTDKAYGKTNLICSHFKTSEDETKYSDVVNGRNNNTNICFYPNTSIATTLAEWKAYLAEQYANGTPVILEYDLAEPEVVPYTEGQQEARNKIKALMTYKNITNITSTAYAKVTYMRDNGLDVYETKQNASKKYTETSEKLAEQKMTVDGVITQVSDITSKTDELTGEVKTINSEISTVKQTIEGWSSELKNTGGNNIFYYSLDFWDNSNGLEEYSDTEIMQNSISQNGYVLNNGSAKQTQSVKNGFYTCSFNYKKLLELAVCQVKINGTTYDLTETDWVEFEQAFEVKTNKIEIEFIGDTDNSLYISDLMVNVGTTKLSWSQNANETRTDTVTIGKGIQVNSSAKNTYHRIDADGNRTFNKTTGKVVNEATDKGTETEELVVRGQAKITGLLIQKVSDQVWINSLL